MQAPSDIKKQNEKLREEITQLKQKLSLLENRPANASKDDRDHLAKIFSVFDRDRDNVLSGPELQDLALQLGEVISNTDVAACFAEIAPGGKLGFEEFFRWWSTPQEYHRDDPGNKKLRLLRLKLQTRPLFELMSSICNAPSVAPDRAPKWPAARGADTAKVDLTVSMGMFDTVAASARVQLLVDPDRAKKLRADLGVSPRACVMSGAFILQQECVDARLKDFKDLLNELLESNRKEKTYSSFSIKETRSESGQRMLWVHVIWESKPEIDLLQELFETIDFRSLDVNLALSQKPGDPNDGFIKARLSVQAEASRAGIDYLVAKISSKDNDEFRRLVNLLSGITGVAVRLDATDLTSVFPKLAKEEPLSTFQGWASVRNLALAMASELNEQSLAVYNTTISVLSAPHIAYVMLEDKFVQASFDNLHVVDVLPTNADFEAALKAEEDGDSDDEAPRGRGKKPAARRARNNNPLHEDGSSSSEEGPLDYDMI